VKKFKYPDTLFNNFGVTPEGEFYAGDVTQSGRTIAPLGVDIDPTRTRELLSTRFSRRDVAYRGFSNLAPNVRGAHLFSVNTGGNVIQTVSKGLRGNVPTQIFKSKLGITAGKTYYPTGTGVILDELGKIVFNVFAPGRGSEQINYTPTILHSDTGSHHGPAQILFETENRLYILVQGQYHGSSDLIWVNKVRVANATYYGYVIAGRFDIEHLGLDVQGRNIFVLFFDSYSPADLGSPISQSNLTGTFGSPYIGTIIRETAPNSDSFSSIGNFTFASSTSTTSVQGATYLQFSMSNAAKELDENGRLLSFSFATHGMGSAGLNSLDVEPVEGWFNWTKFTLNETNVITQTNTRIDLPAPLNLPMKFRYSYSEAGPGIVIQCTQWVNKNKAYFVFSNGGARRLMKKMNQYTQIPDYPVTIMEVELDSTGAFIGNPVFTHIESDVNPGFYVALLDREANRVWWLSDEAVTGNNFIVRSLDVETRSINKAYFSEMFQSAGCHDGKLLVVCVGQTQEVHKYVLEPSRQLIRVSLNFDKISYNKGDSAVLTVSNNSPRDLRAVIELEGCAFTDGADSKEVTLSAGLPLTLNVTVRKGATASVSKIEYLGTEVPTQEPVV